MLGAIAGDISGSVYEPPLPENLILPTFLLGVEIHRTNRNSRACTAANGIHPGSRLITVDYESQFPGVTAPARG
ncbi:MAG: hypothetical protein IMY80_05610 [Chloroflexi bacterium]|nr:hypothetical protein [Chloroflexota bacterium]